ncbi:MAG TPA: exodeoxyribonuclease I [Candidatus Saccharimonadales bacterium]|nr:exodeoxyribonuclease I [Candidatus Saccharimonadales bacterium]
MTFYFYDLETSGFSARNDRIMQFAGQRTDLELNPVGQPDNILIKMTPDILPQPDAVLVHGITPQKTLADGISEAEFTKYLTSQVFTPDTINVGYNNLRFDNEFIRFTFWRNFHDAYEWCWREGCSTWDLLDVVRMTRALRPDGIKWPFAPDGKPSNKLEYLSSVNKLDHADAHDALSDVKASIAVAKLIRKNQPKLFEYLLIHRDKKKIIPLVTSGQPVVYTSGRYPSEFQKTTVAVMVAENETKSGALMYDLRIDPDEFSGLSASELAKRWSARGESAPYFPVKLLSYNKCPAIAPMNVLDDASAERLQLHKELLDNHLKKLKKAADFGDKLLKTMDMMWPKRKVELMANPQTVDSQLYDGFINDDDRTRASAVRAAGADGISKPGLEFKDQRLNALLPLYKARNFPKTLSDSETKAWESFRRQKLLDGGDSSKTANFFNRLDELAKTPGMDQPKQYILEELNLYAQSVLPIPED